MLSFETMTYAVTSNDNYVSLSCAGSFSLHELTPAWRDVQGYLIATGWTHVLVNISGLQTAPEIGEIFDLAKLFWRDFPPSGRIALVVRWDQSTLAKLLEVLMRSVGIYLTVFATEERARAWMAGPSSERLPEIAARTTSQIHVNN